MNEPEQEGETLLWSTVSVAILEAKQDWVWQSILHRVLESDFKFATVQEPCRPLTKNTFLKKNSTMP